MSEIVQKIRAELIKNADEKTKQSGERFFKEEVKMYGMKTDLVGRLGKAAFKEIEDKSKAQVYAMCEELWRSGYMEESFIACNWSYLMRDKYEPGDFDIFAGWINRYVSNWASCDTFCNHTVGAFIEMYPDYMKQLKTWAKSPNRWMRRACAVSLIIPAKQGKFLDDIFEIADSMLLDKDDMVQKGYGWMLKEASRNHEKEVFEYVVENKKVMPRTALRYAIEKMPKELKVIAMEK